MAVKYSGRFGKKIFALHPDALRTLEQFPWPGNIRQLENVVQQAVLSCTGDTLTLGHLPATVHPKPPEGRGETVHHGPASSLAQNRETTERATIIRALEKVSFSRTRSAQLLGVSRVTLYKKMKKYGLLAKPTGLAAVGDRTA